MINWYSISISVVITFFIGVVIGIIIVRRSKKKNEIEGESFRVDCSEKKKGE